MTSLSAIVLAAGPDQLMRSTRPKPLHSLCGKPMLVYALEALDALRLDRRIVMVGESAEQISKKLVETAPDTAVELIQQDPPFASGAAAALAMETFQPNFDLDDEIDDVLIVPADIPLLTNNTLVSLVAAHRQAKSTATVLSMPPTPDHPRYGAIEEGRSGEVGDIISDWSESLAHHETSTGVYCFRRSLLAPALRRVGQNIGSDDVLVGRAFSELHDAGHRTLSFRAPDPAECQSVDDRTELAVVERRLRDRVNRHWLKRGVTMVDPERTIVDTTVVLARDVTLFPGTLLQGTTIIGEGAEIGPDTHLVDCAVGQGARVRQTVGNDAEVGSYADVGPFAVLEPGASMPPATTTGAFHVENSASDPNA